MKAKPVGKSELRSFGLIVAGGFALIALSPLLHHQHPRRWALFISEALVSTALIMPLALRWFHRVWMAIGEALGWVNSRIILGVVFYLAVVPIGVFRRLAGHDPMQRQWLQEAATYRLPSAKRSPAHLRRQF